MEYSFEEFIEDINMGREIEFVYNNIMYFITYNKKGWLLINSVDKKNQCFANSNELLQNAKIDNYNLIELWDKIKIDTVY